jgi:SAM-dependent methyltransferase
MGTRSGLRATLARARRATRPAQAGDVYTRTEPVSRIFGLERGTPVDRFYIERFLESKRDLIGGHVLEIGDSTYTKRFGAAVERAEVLHATGESGATTIVGDLATGAGVPEDVFDCVILTQTLPFIFEVGAAVEHTRRALKPGGWLLATVPGISQISRYDMDRWGDFWRFTDASMKALFGDGFDPVEIETHGNVAAACAFLQGVVAEEMTGETLAVADPDYQLVITVAARRPAP